MEVSLNSLVTAQVGRNQVVVIDRIRTPRSTPQSCSLTEACLWDPPPITIATHTAILGLWVLKLVACHSRLGQTLAQSSPDTAENWGAFLFGDCYEPIVNFSSPSLPFAVPQQSP